jgi:ABC transporter substrate binding protein
VAARGARAAADWPNGQGAPGGHLNARACRGYIEGQNLAIERRDGDWKPDRLPALAAELVGLKVDIIVAWSTPTAHAAKQATNSIPIIAAVMADPARWDSYWVARRCSNHLGDGRSVR